MRIKRFEGKTLKEAIGKVKKELGSDAVILSMKERKGFLGMFGKRAEVVAALDGEAFGIKKDVSLSSEVVEEIRELKTLLRTLIPKRSPGGGNFISVMDELRDRGVSTDIAFALLDALEEGVFKGVDPSQVSMKEFFSLLISKLVKVNGDVKSKFIFLIGPSGSGKSLSSLKLAYLFKENGAKPAIVSMDVRHHSKELMFHYSRRFGVPCQFASSSLELKDRALQLADLDVVIVDTPGFSPYNMFQVEEVKGWINSLDGSRFSYLVFPAPYGDKLLIDFIGAVGSGLVDALLLTKLDEVSSYGFLLNFVIFSGKPISYLSFGQRVPGDLEAATPNMVAELILSKGDSYGDRKRDVV